MDDRVKAEYEKVLSAAIIKNGSMVDNRPSQFAWRDYDTEYDGPAGVRHIYSCGTVSVGEIKEDATWWEFAGTFADDHYKHGMEVHGVTCNCGKITNRIYRWDAPVSEAIKIVLENVLTERIEK